MASDELRAELEKARVQRQADLIDHGLRDRQEPAHKIVETEYGPDPDRKLQGRSPAQDALQDVRSLDIRLANEKGPKLRVVPKE